MEFPYSVNNLFRDEIHLIDNRLVPSRSAHGDSAAKLRDQLYEVIDKMGKASGEAQGLNGPVTSASKMRVSEHRLYIMKEADANNDLGAVVGLLKVGSKKLFIYDHNGAQHELDPMCVLDFYVHESRQRLGYGKKLFEYMLKVEQVKPHHLAIDTPSHKFRSFLQKHYKMKATIQQVNNFVVFEGFFRDRPDGNSKKGRLNASRPPVHPYKRQNVNSYSNQPHEAYADPQGIPSGSDANTCVNSSTSGHGLRSAGDKDPTPPVEYHPHHEQPLQDSSVCEQLSSVHLEATLDDLEPESEGVFKDVNLDRTGSSLSKQNISMRNGNVNVQQTRNMSAQRSAYSRHKLTDTPPDHLSIAQPANGFQVGELSSHGISRTEMTQNAQQPDGAHTNGNTHIQMKAGRVSPPILLRRDGPSRDYLKFRRDLNSQMGTQDRYGHLKLPPGGVRAAQSAHTSKSTLPEMQETAYTLHRTAYSSNPRSRGMSSTWNVMGVPPNYRSPSEQKKWQPTRLW